MLIVGRMVVLIVGIVLVLTAGCVIVRSVGIVVVLTAGCVIVRSVGIVVVLTVGSVVAVPDRRYCDGADRSMVVRAVGIFACIYGADR